LKFRARWPRHVLDGGQAMRRQPMGVTDSEDTLRFAELTGVRPMIERMLHPPKPSTAAPQAESAKWERSSDNLYEALGGHQPFGEALHLLSPLEGMR